MTEKGRAEPRLRTAHRQLLRRRFCGSHKTPNMSSIVETIAYNVGSI